MSPIPTNVYHQSQQNVSYQQQYVPTTSNDMSTVINKTV